MNKMVTAVVVVIAVAAFCMVVPYDSEATPTEVSTVDYDYTTDYETKNGNNGTGQKVTLMSKDEVNVADLSNITLSKWGFKPSSTSGYTKSVYVVEKINGNDTTHVRIQTDAAGYGPVVSWYEDDEGKIWTGTVWEALHLLANGGTVYVHGDVYAELDGSNPEWEVKGGFNITGADDNAHITTINNNTYITMSTYIIKGDQEVIPANQYASLDFNLKSISMDFGLTLNDYALDTAASKDPGKIESISLTLEDVVMESVRGINFFQNVKIDTATNFVTSLSLKGVSMTGLDYNVVYAGYMDNIAVEDCTFTDCAVGISVSNKTDSPVSVSIRDSTFTDCGFGIENQENSAAPIVVSNRGNSTVSLNVSNCDFNYVEKSSKNGDILLGSYDNSTSGDVQFSLETGNQSCILNVWKGTSKEVEELHANGSFRISGIGVNQDIAITDNDPTTPPTGWDDDDDLPPFIPTQPAEDDDTVTIVACAAAAAVAAILAVFLVIDRKG